MERSGIRDLIRKAQSFEIGGEFDQAVELLSQAAHLHLDRGETRRGAALLRHCLRLKPGRADLRSEAERVEAQLPADEPGSAARPALDAPRRGPTPADPALDCWCSFCCRPRGEAGSMVAGPAGAFICRACIGAAADLVCVPSVRLVEAPALASPAPELELLPRPTELKEDRFIEAAVVLSKALGWSLADLRTLSPDEITRALEQLKKLGG